MRMAEMSTSVMWTQFTRSRLDDGGLRMSRSGAWSNVQNSSQTEPRQASGRSFLASEAPFERTSSAKTVALVVDLDRRNV